MSDSFDTALVRETATLEARALTAALEEAFAATLRAPDLPPEEIREGLRDVLATFGAEWERRIPGWIAGVDSPRIDADNSTSNTGERPN